MVEQTRAIQRYAKLQSTGWELTSDSEIVQFCCMSPGHFLMNWVEKAGGA
jgi:hypothetical protein